MPPRSPRSSTLLFGAVLLLSPVARANERHFTQTYESATLPAGAKELELSVSPRLGRGETPYTRFDQRVEVEVRLSDRLQTTLYLNFSLLPDDLGRPTTLGFGLSNEWK